MRLSRGSDIIAMRMPGHFIGDLAERARELVAHSKYPFRCIADLTSSQLHRRSRRRSVDLVQRSWNEVRGQLRGFSLYLRPLTTADGRQASEEVT